MPLKVVATSQPDTRFQDALAGRPRPQGSAGSTLKVIASQAGDIDSGAASGAAEAVGGAVDAIKPVVDDPWSMSEAKFLGTFLKGGEGASIDETFFTQSDRDFLRNKILEISKETGRTRGSLSDYQDVWGIPADEINKVDPVKGIYDVNVRMARTLGKANWEIVDGEVIITDTYNFNSGGYRQAREGMRHVFETGSWPEDIPRPTFKQFRSPMFWLNAIAYEVQEDRREQGKDPDIPVRLNLGKVDE